MKLCTYCGGLERPTRDHVVPEAIKRNGKGKRFDIGPIVPACHECNSLLGDRYLLTVRERAAYLLRRYRARYARLLATPEWTDEELDELGDRLRRVIIGAQMERADVLRRLNHLRLVATPAEADASG